MDNWKMKGKPALIIMHMQNSIVAEDGSLAFFGFAKATTESEIIPRQQKLLNEFREKKLPIIYVVATHPSTFTVPAYGKFWEALASLTANQAGSKDVEIISELVPQTNEPVISNWPIGCFSNSKLEQLLIDNGAETLVLMGVATDIVVLTTTLQAISLFYSVIVAKDCCTTINQKAHDVVLNDILPGFGLVTTAEDIIAHI